MERPNLIIYGRVIALSNVQEIPSKDAGKPAMKKRELYLDCTRYDSLTGLRDENENKPLLEFGGDKMMEKLAALNLQKGDVVGVKFVVQGSPYKDKDGKQRVFTAIRCYDCELVRRANEPTGAGRPETPAPAPQPQPQQAAPVQTSQDGTDGLPF